MQYDLLSQQCPVFTYLLGTLRPQMKLSITVCSYRKQEMDERSAVRLHDVVLLIMNMDMTDVYLPDG